MQEEPKVACIKDRVINIVQDASENYAHMQRNIRALQELHSQDGDEVNKWIEVCLSKVLTAKCGIRNAEGALRFFEMYLKKGFNGPKGELKALTEAQAKLTGDLMEAVFPGINDLEKCVRYRSCQLIALILNQLEELDEDIYQKLRVQLAARTKDKDSDVRAQAVVALSRLQDSGNFYGNRDVTKNILSAMQTDPSSKSALWNIDINKKSVPSIIKMISDVDPQVRSSVFKKLNKERFDYTYLSTEQREDLLYKGLTDPNKEVIKSAIKFLLESWGGNHQNSIPEILKILVDVTNSRVASLVVKSLLEAGFNIGIDDGDETHIITAEEVYTLIIAWDHYNKLKNFDILETLLPPVKKNIECIEYWYNAIMNSNKSRREEFTFEQLLNLAKRQDYSDEMLRTTTIELLGTFLDGPKIYSIMQFLYIVYSDVVSWCKKALELSTSYKSLNNEDILKLFSIDSSSLPSSLLPITLNEDFDDSIPNTAEELIRCFEIAKAVFRIIDIGDLEDKYLLRLMESFLRDLVYPALQSKSIYTYILGLQTLSMYIISDKDLFIKHVHLFETPKFSNLQILGETIKVLTDGVLLYGTSSIPALETTMYSILEFALGSDDDTTLLLGAKAASKLLLSGRLSDENLTKKLCLLYLLSKDSGQINLYECLSQFFFFFSLQSRLNRILIQKILVPTIEELSLCTEDESPSESIPYISNCAAIIIDLLATTPEEKSDEYYTLPLLVLESLQIHLNHKVIRPVLINVIQHPYLSQCNVEPSQIKRLKLLSDQLMKTHITVKERRSLTQMVKNHLSSRIECTD